MVCRKPLLPREVTIIRRLKRVHKMPVTKIATAVDRNKSSVYKALDPKWLFQQRGRGKSLSYKEVTRIIRIMKDLIRRAKTRDEVTLGMIKRKAKCTACNRTVRTWLAQRNIKFRRLRTKPLLTSTDRMARRAFALKLSGCGTSTCTLTSRLFLSTQRRRAEPLMPSGRCAGPTASQQDEAHVP